MKIIESTNDPRSEYFDLMRRESIPAEELMGRRMEIGVVAVLGQLRAKRNWHRIFREWVYADPPATELGEQEWEYFEEEDSSEAPGSDRDVLSRMETEEDDEQDQTRLGSDQEELGAAERAPRTDPVPALRGVRDDLRWRSSSSVQACTSSTTTSSPARSRCLVIGIYVLSVVGFYFSVGLAAAADLIFRGEEATSPTASPSPAAAYPDLRLGGDLHRDQRRDGPLENQGGVLGTIAARLVGMAWALVTFLAVPVIAIEGTGPLETLKRSASPLQRTLGPADHRQPRDRRRDLPARRAAGGDPDRRRHPDLVLRLFLGALLVIIGADAWRSRC